MSTQRFHPSVLSRPFLLALAVLAASWLTPGAPAAQAQIDQGLGKTTEDPGIQFIPATPFSWSTTVGYTGPVKIPVGPGGGWMVTPQGQWRIVPAYSPDPTFEVILFPPYSGHPTASERFLVQVPLGPLGGVTKAKGMVLGFHPSSLSEKSVFQGSGLPAICHDRRWILLAPYGLSEFNFANANSQNTVDTVLDLVAGVFPFNEKRIYTVGFSMGGMSAVSWAMRHLDRTRFRAAGVVDHTGTMDAVATYNGASTALKNVMAEPVNFAGTPTSNPFSYDRVSPIRFLAGGLVDPDKTPVTNIRHLPFYLHYNQDDPNTNLVQQTIALHGFLLGMGAEVKLDIATVPNTHHWSTLDMQKAINWIGRHEIDPDPSAVEMYVDTEREFLFTEARNLIPGTTTRYEVSVGSGNHFDVYNTLALRTLAVDPDPVGLDVNSTLTFDVDSMDGTTDVIIVRRYASPPSSVLEDGVPATWVHYPDRQELRITPTHAPASLSIVP